MVVGPNSHNIDTVTIVLSLYRFLLSVHQSVCNRCGRGHNEFAGRVQKSSRAFNFHRNAFW